MMPPTASQKQPALISLEFVSCRMRRTAIRVRQSRVSVGLRRCCARRHPKLPPASPFVPAENPDFCHAHQFRCFQGLLPCRSPLHGHLDDVQCEMARQCRLAYLLLFQATLYLWAASLEREEFQQLVASILCRSSSLSSPSLKGGGASAMLVVDSNAVGNDDMDRPHPRASARDDNPRIARYVSHVALLRETSQDSPVTQKRYDSSSCEMDPSVRRHGSHRPSRA